MKDSLETSTLKSVDVSLTKNLKEIDFLHLIFFHFQPTRHW